MIKPSFQPANHLHVCFGNPHYIHYSFSSSIGSVFSIIMFDGWSILKPHFGWVNPIVWKQWYPWHPLACTNQCIITKWFRSAQESLGDRHASHLSKCRCPMEIPGDSQQICAAKVMRVNRMMRKGSKIKMKRMNKYTILISFHHHQYHCSSHSASFLHIFSYPKVP